MKRQSVDSPIGVFDSGVGGLTVLKAMHALMPNEDYFYLGDTARLPYGTKSRETIIKYALQVSAHLVRQHIKMLVVACNTATSAALPELQTAFPDIPVIGVIEPGAEAACKASKSGHIAVIATDATVRGDAYRKAILRHRPDALVESMACPLFTAMAEDGLFAGKLAESLAARYLDKIFHPEQKNNSAHDRPDCLVLGCTHYPLLAGAIRNVIGKDVAMVDSAATTAQKVRQTLQEQNLARSEHTGHCKFFTTDDRARFARIGRIFLNMQIQEDDVQLLDL